MVDQSIIDTAKNYIEQIPKDVKLKKAYLFGSYARGKAREESDIDIALVIENMVDFFSTQKLLMKLRRTIDLRIEPHPIGENEFTRVNPFAHEIQKYGIELNIEDKTAKA